MADVYKSGNGEFIENSELEKRSSAESDTQNEFYRNADIKKIIRKMDLRILPVMSVLYLMSFLDRTNIGNARIAGLQTDLRLTAYQYNWAVTVFFFTYAVIEMPSNLVLKKVGAKIWLPFIMFFWGICCIGIGFSTNYASLLATRLLLGLFEGGLFPGVTYYLTTFYPRSMCALRIAIFFSAATIAGAFGGLLAYGIQQMDGAANLGGWQWIFILEGVLTSLVAIGSYFMIPASPETCHWLTHDERMTMKYKIEHDGNLRVPMDDAFHWDYVIAGLTDWKLYINFFQYFCTLIPLYSVALSLPSILRDLGFTTIDSAQLHTVPVYIVACVFVVFAAYLADRFGRAPIILLFLSIGAIGWGLAMGLPVSNQGGRYAAVFLAAIGSYSAFPPVVAALTSNVGGKCKRATEVGIQVGFGGLAGGVTPWLFRPQDAPGYKFGCRMGVIFAAIAMAATLLNWFLLSRANAQKRAQIESGEAARYTDLELSRMGDRSPYYMYTY